MKNCSKNYSLRRRLISLISIPVILLLLVAMGLGYKFAEHEIEEVYDAQLVHSAKVLWQLTNHEILEDEDFQPSFENRELQHKYERNLGFRIWVGNKLVMQSTNTETFGSIHAPPGFSNQIIDGKDWRFLVYLDPENQIKIELSELYHIRYELVIQLMVSLILPLLLILPILLVIIWFGVKRIVRPVVEISEEVDQRDGSDLSAIERGSLPAEIAPFVQALNRLFGRLQESFKREREFTDHAAHELRTPLAAMKTQTQVMLRRAGDNPEYKDSLKNLHESINRATRMVEQLLSFSRLQHEELPRQELDLSILLESLLPDFRAAAKEKNIIFVTDIVPSYPIMAHEGSLTILLRNLLENALKYTPSGGHVSVELLASGQMYIADTGPGLSDKDKARAFDRFLRFDKTGQAGSGLGLSIAQWVAQTHGTRIQLHDNKPSGLKVSVDWSDKKSAPTN